VTLLLFVFQSSLQSPFKSFLKNNDKSLSPKKEKSSRRLSALVRILLKYCGNFGVRAVERELFHLVAAFWFLTHAVSTIRIKLFDYLMVKSQGIPGEEYLGFQLRVWLCFLEHPGLW